MAWNGGGNNSYATAPRKRQRGGKGKGWSDRPYTVCQCGEWTYDDAGGYCRCCGRCLRGGGKRQDAGSASSTEEDKGMAVMRALLTMLDKDRDCSGLACIGELRGILHKNLDIEPTAAQEGDANSFKQSMQNVNTLHTSLKQKEKKSTYLAGKLKEAQEALDKAQAACTEHQGVLQQAREEYNKAHQLHCERYPAGHPLEAKRLEGENGSHDTSAKDTKEPETGPRPEPQDRDGKGTEAEPELAKDDEDGPEGMDDDDSDELKESIAKRRRLAKELEEMSAKVEQLRRSKRDAAQMADGDKRSIDEQAGSNAKASRTSSS